VLQALEELTEQLDTTHQLALRHQALSPEFAPTPSAINSCPSSGAPCNTALTPVTLPFDRSTAFDDNKLVRQLQDRFAELQEVLGRVSESEHQNRAVSTSEEAAANSVALRESAESELTAIRQQLSEFARQKLQPSKSFDAETQARIAKSREEQRIYWVEKQRIHRDKQQEEAQQKSAELGFV